MQSDATSYQVLHASSGLADVAGPMAGAIFASLFYSLFMEPIAMDLVDMDAYPVKLPAFPGTL